MKKNYLLEIMANANVPKIVFFHITTKICFKGVARHSLTGGTINFAIKIVNVGNMSIDRTLIRREAKNWCGYILIPV